MIPELCVSTTWGVSHMRFQDSEVPKATPTP
jgi:hypothetical protein